VSMWQAQVVHGFGQEAGLPQPGIASHQRSHCPRLCEPRQRAQSTELRGSPHERRTMPSVHLTQAR
jgi:hypothetical protein